MVDVSIEDGEVRGDKVFFNDGLGLDNNGKLANGSVWNDTNCALRSIICRFVRVVLSSSESRSKPSVMKRGLPLYGNLNKGSSFFILSLIVRKVCYNLLLMIP